MCIYPQTGCGRILLAFELYKNEITLYFSTARHDSNIDPDGCFATVHLFSLMCSFPLFECAAVYFSILPSVGICFVSSFLLLHSGLLQTFRDASPDAPARGAAGAAG